MDLERWPEAGFPQQRFHPDLTAISERPSEELELRDAYERRLEPSSEPAYWSTESIAHDQRSSPAREEIAKAKARQLREGVDEQAFEQNCDGTNWTHRPTTPRNTYSPQYDVDACSEERMLLSQSRQLVSNMPKVSQRLFDSKDGDHHERAPRTQRAVSPVRESGERGSCPRYTLTTFLIALSAVCLVAVFIDIRWRAEEGGDHGTTAVHVHAPATAAVTDSTVEKYKVASARSTRTLSTSPRRRHLGPSSVGALRKGKLRKHTAWVTPALETDAVDHAMKRKRRRDKVAPTATLVPESRHTNYSWRAVRTIPTASTSRSSTFHVVHASTSRRPRVLLAPIQKPTNHRCGVAFYTYCSQTRHDVYYRHVTRSCVRTITDNVQVCNHSPNRFATLEACKHSCIRSELPSESCFEKTLFSWCSRQDVTATWWTFNGKHCQPWHFPKGLCPDFATTDVFASQHECMGRCFPLRRPSFRRHAGRRRLPPCRTSKAGTVCDVDVLKFPYFADVATGSGRVRCLKSSASYLLDHRCLIGSNHFLTETACKKTCVDSAPGRRPKYILS
ncbi:hypothetical protein HPB50_011063 [Hyalomma asiaticum]|uniref:Uncharacterized protein n=1 Tax=Hyalomma asiaticum TaxID=266040 RepID=A0ACB7S4D3_HYAAI|nr:hypothetical protein HPB50_011063 [Hyalomma asiaticum]